MRRLHTKTQIMRGSGGGTCADPGPSARLGYGSEYRPGSRPADVGSMGSCASGSSGVRRQSSPYGAEKIARPPRDRCCAEKGLLRRGRGGSLIALIWRPYDLSQPPVGGHYRPWAEDERDRQAKPPFPSPSIQDATAGLTLALRSDQPWTLSLRRAHVGCWQAGRRPLPAVCPAP